MFKKEKEPFLSSGSMREKELITDVQCQQENPNPRVYSVGVKLDKPRFRLEWWTL